MKITDYNIVVGKDQIDLEDKVESYLLEGWQPLGGLAIIDTALVKSLYQAMVKYQHEEAGKNRSPKRIRSTSKK